MLVIESRLLATSLRPTLGAWAQAGAIDPARIPAAVRRARPALLRHTSHIPPSRRAVSFVHDGPRKCDPAHHGCRTRKPQRTQRPRRTGGPSVSVFSVISVVFRFSFLRRISAENAARR